MEIETIIAIVVAVVIAGLIFACNMLYSKNQELNKALGAFETQRKVLTDTIKNKDADIETANQSIQNLTDYGNKRATEAATALEQAKKDSTKNTQKANDILSSNSTHLKEDSIGQAADTQALIDRYIADRKNPDAKQIPSPAPSK